MNQKIILNEKQKIVHNNLLEFMKNVNHHLFYLFGYAGTGKTFLLAYMVINLIKEKIVDKVYVCAPTHTALEILESYFKYMAELLGTNTEFIDFMTIHKMLEYKPTISYEDGEKKFVNSRDPRIIKRIDQKKLIVVDECSMLSKDLSSDIIKYSKQYNTKFLISGDPEQLPPVNESQSLIFKKSDNFVYKYILTNIMRTKNNDIKLICKAIRKWDGNGKFIKVIQKIYENQKVENGVKPIKIFNNKSNFRETSWFRKIVEKIKNGESPIILVWRNITSDNYNSAIRASVNANINLVEYNVDDQLMIKDYYKSLIDESVYYASHILKIVDVNELDIQLIKWSDYYVKDAKTAKENAVNKLLKSLNELDCNFTANILSVVKKNSVHGEELQNTITKIQTISLPDVKRYTEYLDQIKNKLIFFSRRIKCETTMKSLWKVYYEVLKEPYANISFGYSMTVHKAQGATFIEVFVQTRDILVNPDRSEAKKSLYTSTTRVAEYLDFMI
jgi:ATP-dependent exoDNAse (exonuclease V) alpha subunit